VWLPRSGRGFLALTLVVATHSAAAGAAPRTTRDRIYTAAQAGRGKQLYQEACVQCHALDLYRGETMKSWNGGLLSDLYDALSVKMPPGNPGSLKRREYADILAYIVSLNGMPAGEQELPSAAAELKAIRIKWGNKP
jgi:S-disulfanyl-L-cysteine oxidoreductase SoxD